MKHREWPVHPDPCPQLMIERGPEDRGVGSWVPRDKHRLLSDYLNGTRQAWKKWPQRTLIDPFCGPGRIQVKGESFTRDGGAVVAWRQSQASGAPFTKVLVGDLVGERSNACASRLAALGANVTPFVGPAIETVPAMMKQVPSGGGSLCFAYIDPYNLQYLSFPLLKQLASLKVDLAIHFSTMDLLRNVDHELDPQRARFDEVAPGWRANARVVQASKNTLATEFFRYWMALVKDLNFTVAKEMPLITNDSNHGLYRMVFFARHELPLRIWDDVARGATGDLFGG